GSGFGRRISFPGDVGCDLFCCGSGGTAVGSEPELDGGGHFGVGDGGVLFAMEEEEGDGRGGGGEGGVADGTGGEGGGGDEVAVLGGEAVGHACAGGVAGEINAGFVDGVGVGEIGEEGGEEIDIRIGVGGEGVPGVARGVGFWDDEEEIFGVDFLD